MAALTAKACPLAAALGRGEPGDDKRCPKGAGVVILHSHPDRQFDRVGHLGFNGRSETRIGGHEGYSKGFILCRENYRITKDCQLMAILAVREFELPGLQKWVYKECNIAYNRVGTVAQQGCPSTPIGVALNLELLDKRGMWVQGPSGPQILNVRGNRRT